MKNVLLLVGGLALGYGIYKIYQGARKKKSCACGGSDGTVIGFATPAGPMSMQEQRQQWADAATVKYDTNPVSTFAPAKTQIIAPPDVAYGIQNYNMAGELVCQ